MCSGGELIVECAFCGVTDKYSTMLNHINTVHNEEEPASVEYNFEDNNNNNLDEQIDDSTTSTMNSDSNEASNMQKDGTEWTEGQTKLLLDKYEQYLPQVGPMKKFKRKKDLWTKISSNLNEILDVRRTPLQCENRYKTILKRKKKAVDHNSKTGEAPLKVPYENELGKIAAIDDSIQPEVAIDQQHCVIHEKNLVPSIKRKKEKTVQEVLTEINEKKQEACEKRHKEKLEFMREMMQTYFSK